VNQGGEPEHDDFGLPRVDIQVPDDARELYADVQAYYRELRAIRRHERSRRWRAPLRRSGVVIPVIAGALILAMIASMVLTMFSANPYFSGISGPDPSGPARNGSPARPGTAGGGPRTGQRTPTAQGRGPATSPATMSPNAVGPGPGAGAGAPSQTAGAPLPGESISVAGKPVALRQLTSTVLAIIPAHCGCATVIGQLLTQAASAGITVYLVGPRGSLAELTSLGARKGTTGTARLAIDARNVLDAAYRPVGLTLLLIDSRGAVTVAPGLRAGVRLETQLRALKLAS
jgi:hypothetical protein